MEPKFKVGDKVRAFGIDGVVTGTTSFITVSFPSKEMNFVFLPDGRTREWHNDPSLVLVERPKKKVKKHGWVNIFGLDAAPGQTFSSRVYTSCEDAAEAVIRGSTLYKILAFDYEIEE